MSFLNRLDPVTRRTIYKDYLGAGSMSVALLRQTCREVQSEIDCAHTITRDGGRKLVFHRQVDACKLHGCSMALIESIVGPINHGSIDVFHWDQLFCNAIAIGSLQDVGRLLDMFVYPLSRIFRCESLYLWSDSAISETYPLFQYIGSFVRLVSLCDAKTIRSYYDRLPCACARLAFMSSTIQQSMFGVLDCIMSHLDILIQEGDIGSPAQFFGYAVGLSGDQKMFCHVADILDVKLRSAYHHTCYVAAAGKNHVTLLCCITPDDDLVASALVCAVTNDCRDAIQYLQQFPISAKVLIPCLAAAAWEGNSFVFQYMLSRQPEPSSTEWHASFSTTIRCYVSLRRAFERSIDDLVFFLDLYSNHFSHMLVPIPPFIAQSDQSKIWTFLLRRAKNLTASRLAALLKNMVKYLDADPREVYMDAIHFLIQQRNFRLDLVNAIMEPFLSHISSRPLSIDEMTDMALMTFEDEAFDWVVEHFEVAISPEEASNFVPLYCQKIGNFGLQSNYYRRCKKLGASIEPGRSVTGDAVLILLGFPYTPSNHVSERHLQQLVQMLLSWNRMELIKTFVDSVKAAQPQGAMLNWLRKICISSSGGLMRYKKSGCFEASAGPFSAVANGQLRLYHYACKLFGVSPANLYALPDPELHDE